MLFRVVLRGDFETVVLWLPPFHRQRCLHLMSVSVSKCLCVCVCALLSGPAKLNCSVNQRPSAVDFLSIHYHRTEMAVVIID